MSKKIKRFRKSYTDSASVFSALQCLAIPYTFTEASLTILGVHGLSLFWTYFFHLANQHVSLALYYLFMAYTAILTLDHIMRNRE